MHSRGVCPAIDRDCFRCGTNYHFGLLCKKPQPRYGWQKHTVGVADPTPMMENVKVFPHDGGKQFTFKMCPDTGCTMTLISEDMMAHQGMTMDMSWLELSRG